MGFLYLSFSSGAMKSWAPVFMQSLLLQRDPYAAVEEFRILIWLIIKNN